MPALPIKAFIFDLDGVLTDTAKLHADAWRRLATEHGWPFDQSLADCTRGVPRDESLRLVLGDRQVDEATFKALMQQKNQYYVQAIEQLTPADVLPGVLDLLAEIDAAGLKWAVASASKNARQVLERLNLLGRAHAVSDGRSVINNKPAPDLFLHAAEQLGVPPENCVVIEDAAAGIEAAQAANMWTIGLGPADRTGGADFTAESIEELHRKRPWHQPATLRPTRRTDAGS
jgi:kojibiose phosphorylase